MLVPKKCQNSFLFQPTGYVHGLLGVQAYYQHLGFKEDCFISQPLLCKLFVRVHPKHSLDAHFTNSGQKPRYMYVHGIF